MGSEEPDTVSSSPAQHADTRGASGKFAGRRAKKPRLLAVVTEQCTACAGSPVCQIYCPVDECMILVPTNDGFPYGRIWVDPLKCVGCKKCIGRGPEGIFLDGCPWDAIEMVPTPQWESLHGELAY
jgi:ferredoxin